MTGIDPKIHLYVGDLPDNLDFGDAVAVDTETQGLSLVRDRLCLAQLSGGDGICHLVQFVNNDYAAPNLKRILSDPQVEKIFHYARFDVAMIRRYLGVDVKPVYCTKIASKLVRTYTGGHGLKDLCQEILGIKLDKEQQSSDWAAEKLSPEQQAYAASDVLYLHKLRDALSAMLVREARLELARSCFDFLSVRAELDLMGWDAVDIFAHK